MRRAYHKLKVRTKSQRILGFLTVCGPIVLVAGSLGGTFHQAPPDQSVLAKGLAIWRKPGKIQGNAACATCHSPDGIEIAAYNFDDADLVRRARPHLSDGDADLLVEYFHALRSKFGFTKLRDRNLDRPLQPGGAVLEGATPADRDWAFGKELKALIPDLFNGRIETVDQAKAAETQLLSLDLTNLKVGIPLNRLSEDVAHGTDHSSIAQWLPEVPPLIAPRDQEDWYAAEDRYLADPTQDRLHGLLIEHGKLVNTSRMLGLSVMSAVKFRALLVWQDRIRNRTENLPLNVSKDVLEYGNFNPIWEVGEVARDLMDRDPNGLGMDRDTQAKKLSGASLSEQLHELRLAWFWAGWLSDQGLFKTSHDDKVTLGMWISESLSKDGPYPIHNVFANTRRQAVVSNDSAAWGEPIARKRRIWDFAGLRSFGFQLKDMPQDPDYRKLYVDFTANCFRMNLLLLKDDIETKHEVWAKISAKSNVNKLVEFIKSQQPDESANAEKLRAGLFVLIDAAKERF
jgi:hypothetical protein